jgi:predicted  nucleic acid-binding Zn-ribbon protein
MQAYKELIESLDFVYHWTQNQEPHTLPRLKLSLEKLKAYITDEKLIDETIREIEIYEKKSWITRKHYFDKEGSKRISSLARKIVKIGGEKARREKPELQPAERAILVEKIYKFIRAKGKTKAIMESADWERRIDSPLEELLESFDKMREICPWIKFTENFSNFAIYHLTYHRVGKSKEKVTGLINTAHAMVEDIIKEYNITEDEIKKFSHAELEEEVEERKRIIEDLEKNLKKKEEENRKLAEENKKMRTEIGEIRKELNELKERVETEISEKEAQLQEKNQEIRRLISQVQSLQKELDDITLKSVPVDAQTVIKRYIMRLDEAQSKIKRYKAIVRKAKVLLGEKKKRVSNLENLLAKKEEIAKSLQNQVKELTERLREKESEIDNLKSKLAEKDMEIEKSKESEVEFHFKLEESLEELKRQRSMVSDAILQRKTLADIRKNFDYALSIFLKIYTSRLQNREAGEYDNRLVRKFLEIRDEYLPPSTSQPEAIVEAKIGELWAECETWESNIKSQAEIEKEFSYL